MKYSAQYHVFSDTFNVTVYRRKSITVPLRQCTPPPLPPPHVYLHFSPQIVQQTYFTRFSEESIQCTVHFYSVCCENLRYSSFRHKIVGHSLQKSLLSQAFFFIKNPVRKTCIFSCVFYRRKNNVLFLWGEGRGGSKYFTVKQNEMYGRYTPILPGQQQDFRTLAVQTNNNGVFKNTNTLNMDRDPEFWPNLEKNNVREKLFFLTIRKLWHKNFLFRQLSL